MVKWIKGKKWWRFAVAFAVCLPLLVGRVALAGTSEDVTVTAAGYVCEAPGGFTLTYVNDYQVDISWAKGTDAVNTMVRAAYNHYPSGIGDGYLVYYGAGTSISDNATSLASPDVVYYRAWSQNADGVWNEVGYAEGDTGGFMSASFLFIGILSIAIFLTYMASKRPEMLVRVSAGLTWMSMGFWVLLGGITNLGLANSWTQILVWVFFIMAVVPFLFQMNTEIRRESRGRSWREWGNPPEETESNYERHRRELRARLGRQRRRRLL